MTIACYAVGMSEEDDLKREIEDSSFGKLMVEVTCLRCAHKFETTLDSISAGKASCDRCSSGRFASLGLTQPRD